MTIAKPVLAALAGGALLAAGCGSTSSASPGATTRSIPSSPSSGKPPRVFMRSLAFYPVTTHVKVGQTVTWINGDFSPHNVTYVSGPRFRSSPILTPGAKFSIKFTTPGTVHYYCTIHPWMRATIVVSP
jgi:amicyanin